MRDGYKLPSYEFLKASLLSKGVCSTGLTSLPDAARKEYNTGPSEGSCQACYWSNVCGAHYSGYNIQKRIVMRAQELMLEHYIEEYTADYL